MDDGWWWEVSTGYNLWVAYELTQAAVAAQPWGIDLVHLEVPADYSPYAMIMPSGLHPPYGVSFEKWGPQRRTTRSLKHFWDAIVPVADYRGIAFGMNDGHEEKVGGFRLELPYYVFRDPAYATIIKQAGQRDLLYGVAVQETNARWSDAPYLGMRYFPADSAADQMRKNRQSLPPVTDRGYGKQGPFSEPVLQRRLLLVTDDYVVMADYLKGTKPHTFDNLLQLRSLSSLTAPTKQFVRHEAQYSPDPHSAAQCITDVDWYRATAPSVAKFQFDYGPAADNSGTREMLNEPGPLHLDVHSLWPQRQELMVAMPPETHDNQQWVSYEVRGDGQTLAHGESGIWILGQREIDVSV
nr:hypothetical protein [Tanacetum cinerariifolium]